MRPRPPRLSRGLAAVAAVTLISGAGIALASQASAAAGCRVTYSANSWNTGFTGNINLTNLGDPISSGWTLTWDFAGNQHITQGWSATFAQSGQHVTVTNPSWAASLGTNASASFGFNGDYSGTNTSPTSFSLNGVACTGTPTGTTSPTTGTPTTAPPTSTPPTTAPPTSAPPTSTPPGTRADNPYAGVKGYVNPEWSTKAAAEPGGSRVSNNPTAVWLDRIAAINGTTDSSSNGSMGVRAHLDAALAQGAGYIQFVIYDLPGRDCSALASNGELGTGDLQRYKTEYIDPIAAIQGDAKYKNIRIINIVEIDSLPNLVTNTNVATCATMKSNGGYVNGIAYALQKLGAIGNVYNYLDAAHHGWIGWDSNFGPTADIMYQTAVASGNVNNVTGFITNTANYSALTEPNFNINTTVNGTSVRQSKWVDWNQYVDELSFAQAFRTKLVSVGFNSNIGMLIDTSRNGWGGPNRPAAASTSTNVDTFVNESRIDRRIHAGNWCNQSGAGLGERPKAAPATGIDAYVWVKPPGESDGSSALIPNNEGKGFDRMCDPTYTGNDRNGNNPTGALPNAPISGAWFSAQFQQLMANAYPALS
jgi:cellulose 1,4-beta-cellobiosidase